MPVLLAVWQGMPGEAVQGLALGHAAPGNAYKGNCVILAKAGIHLAPNHRAMGYDDPHATKTAVRVQAAC